MSSLKHLRWRGKHRTRGGIEKGERTTVVLGEQVCEKEGRRELVRINNLTACSYTSTVQLEEGMSYVIYVAAKDKNKSGK